MGMDFGRMPGNEEKMMKLLFQEERKGIRFSLPSRERKGRIWRAGRWQKARGGQPERV